MSSLPVDIYSVATVREIDRTAIEDEGIAGYTLMTRAGAATVSEARRRFPEAQRWQVVCGAGNNAGDGYVVAKLAANEGIAVSTVAVVDPTKLQGDAATAYGDLAAEGGVVLPWSAWPSMTTTCTAGPVRAPPLSWMGPRGTRSGSSSCHTGLRPAYSFA